MCEDICALLSYEESKLGFLLENVLYVMLCSFKIDFHGGQVHWVWAGSTQEESLTFVTA